MTWCLNITSFDHRRCIASHRHVLARLDGLPSHYLGAAGAYWYLDWRGRAHNILVGHGSYL
jgi:hypothetical protein